MPDPAATTRPATGTPLDTELRFLLLAAQREGSRLLGRALDPIDLTPAQAEVLTVISEQQPLTLVDLGRNIVCETASPSRIVDALVRRGLVDRRPGEVDRRIVLLTLSKAGQALIPQVRAVEKAFSDATLANVPMEQKAAMAEFLRLITRGTPGGDAVARRFGHAA